MSAPRAIILAFMLFVLGSALTWAAWSAGEERGYQRGVQYAAHAAQPTATPTYPERIDACYERPATDLVEICLQRLGTSITQQRNTRR